MLQELRAFVVRFVCSVFQPTDLALSAGGSSTFLTLIRPIAIAKLKKGLAGEGQ